MLVLLSKRDEWKLPFYLIFIKKKRNTTLREETGFSLLQINCNGNPGQHWRRPEVVFVAKSWMNCVIKDDLKMKTCTGRRCGLCIPNDVRCDEDGDNDFVTKPSKRSGFFLVPLLFVQQP